MLSANKAGIMRGLFALRRSPGAMQRVTLLSFRGARSASPESILPIVVMDSGLSPSGCPGMTVRLDDPTVKEPPCDS